MSLAQYEQNLRKLVKRLKATRAKLMWCSTNPVPRNFSPRRKGTDVLKFNAVAQKIVRRNGICVSDLYSFAKGRLESIQRHNDMHFTAEGSTDLAKWVAKSISDVLKQ